jgi:hypothetical protein
MLLIVNSKVARWFIFRPKISIWAYFCRPWNGKFDYFLMAILVLLGPFGAFYLHLVYFEVIWYIFSRFGMLEQEKSGNPGELVYLAVRKNTSILVEKGREKRLARSKSLFNVRIVDIQNSPFKNSVSKNPRINSLSLSLSLSHYSVLMHVYKDELDLLNVGEFLLYGLQ